MTRLLPEGEQLLPTDQTLLPLSSLLHSCTYSLQDLIKQYAVGGGLASPVMKVEVTTWNPEWAHSPWKQIWLMREKDLGWRPGQHSSPLSLSLTALRQQVLKSLSEGLLVDRWVHPPKDPPHEAVARMVIRHFALLPGLLSCRGLASLWIKHDHLCSHCLRPGSGREVARWRGR